MRYYSEDHVWVQLDDRVATLGISRHAADELGELTFVELPIQGSHIAAGEVLCVVESVKTAADVACPIAGTVHQVNGRLADEPALVNTHPEADGWICRLRDVCAADLQRLMTARQYEAAMAGQTDPSAPA